jgi:hypothetical protein
VAAFFAFLRKNEHAIADHDQSLFAVHRPVPVRHGSAPKMQQLWARDK